MSKVRDEQSLRRIAMLLAACGRTPAPPGTTVAEATLTAMAVREAWLDALAGARDDLAQDEAHLAALEAAIAEHGEPSGER